MRILVLTKRQYTQRDLLDDRYGRLRELPLALAALGHEITGLCLSYRRRDEGRRDDRQEPAGVAWHTLNLHRLLPLGSNHYWQTVDAIGRDRQPELIWACSDAPHALLGVHVARRLQAALVIDLYDNFESYALTRLPGLTTALRWAIRQADGVTCVSAPLLRYVRETCAYPGPMTVIENAVPSGLFYPRDQAGCRRELHLPAAPAILIGTAGALSTGRGIECLFQAFHALANARPDVHLILAGPRDRGLAIPPHPRIHDLGILPPDRIPILLSALDVSVICNRRSAFGDYCFPQKFHESIACQRPVVAAAVGALGEWLQPYPAHRFEPDNPDSLLAALHGQIDAPSLLPLTAPTWNTLGTRLAAFLQSGIDARRRKATRKK